MHPAPPPRSIGFDLTVRTLFGGLLGQFGWIFVAFGMVFVWAFDAGSGVAELFSFVGDVDTTVGHVTGYESTNLSVNDTQVYATHYEFEVDGARHVGTSYDTGDWIGRGESVVVEYRARNPETSRIQGLRASQAGLGVVFVFLFPGIGLALGLGSLRRGIRTRRLLVDGVVTRGTLVATEATNTRVNERPVMKLTFEFEPDHGGGTYQAVARTHQPDRLEDEQKELLVYDPRDPSQASMLDELSCEPRFDATEALVATTGGMPAALLLLLPGLSTLTIVRYAASLF